MEGQYGDGNRWKGCTEHLSYPADLANLANLAINSGLSFPSAATGKDGSEVCGQDNRPLWVPYRRAPAPSFYPSWIDHLHSG